MGRHQPVTCAYMLSQPDRSGHRHEGIVSRDQRADGAWWFGVTTTHVFCSPSCPCRTPLAEHVEYFATPADALRAGFRPCRRCRPLGDTSLAPITEGELRTPLGSMVALASVHGLALLEFADRSMLPTQRERVRRLFREDVVAGAMPWLGDLQVQLDEYFAGRRVAFDVPLLPLGTPFQRAVWRELARIPCGGTSTYDAIARRLRRPEAQRAVGRANGDNRLAILLPCHRVIGTGGQLVGYGGGLWRKQALLEVEGTRPSRRGVAGPQPARRAVV